MAQQKRKRGGYSPINLTSPGSMFTLAFIALAVGLGLLLTRGLTPSSTLTDPGQQQEYEMVLETPMPGQKGLQLKTLKFKECASTVTIDLLLDRSSSMDVRTPSGVTKLTRLKEAVSEFIANAKDTSIIGFQSFSSSLGFAPLITNDVPVSYYKDVKTILPRKIASLNAFGNTPTHDALAFSYSVLREAIPKFPTDRKFNFIFISDGAPCPGIDCSESISSTTPDQDPRLYSPNPADEIKKLGVTVYTLGIYASGQKNLPFLEDLLKSIATSPNHYYAASSGDQVKDLLKQISNKICSQANASPIP